MLLYLSILIPIGIAFVLCLSIDNFICSKRFNDFLLRRALKSIDKVALEQQEKTLQWLQQHIVIELGVTTSSKDIISHLPVDLCYKVKDKQLKAYMSKLGYYVVSNCFLDPDYYSVKLSMDTDENRKDV